MWRLRVGGESLASRFEQAKSDIHRWKLNSERR